MKWNTRPLVLAALGMLLTATNATAAASWSTFLGGADYDFGTGIAVDASGNSYVTGSNSTLGPDSGTWGDPILPFVLWEQNVFVAKLDSNGALLWNTFLGGAGSGSGGNGIAVDASGGVYVTGWTSAPRGSAPWGDPISPVPGSPSFSRMNAAFVAKLDTDGALLWNTFLGGVSGGYTGSDGFAITVDPGGNVSVLGSSDCSWGSPIRPFAGGVDTFVARFDTDGGLLWNTFLGGTSSDHGRGIAVDASGNLYVTGSSPNAWGSPVRSWSGSSDAFAAKIDASGALLWNTFLGGPGGEGGYAIALDPSGGVCLAGRSGSTWGAPIREWSGNEDAFVARLDADGGLTWNSFLGGAEYGGLSGDSGKGIAVDPNGNIFVTGESDATWGGPSSPWSGYRDPFVAKLTANGALTWHTFLGGIGDDLGTGIAVDADGSVFLTGFSYDNAWGAPLRSWSGASDGFVVKLGNSLIVADAQTLSTLEGTAGAITLSALHSDGYPLTFSIVTPPAHGTLSGVPPDLTYHPAAGFTGTDAFTFQAHDGWLDSNVATVTITVMADVAAPAGSILINGGAASTTTTAVTLNLTATDTGGSGVASMRFRNRDSDPYSAWEPFQATRAWTLPGGLGLHKVYAQFMDRAGNISDANPAAVGAQGYVDGITLRDGIAPSGSIRINSGAASTNTAAVTLTLSAADLGGSGLGTMRFRNRDVDPYSAWEPYQTTKPWTLFGGAGTRKVYVQFRDLAGNVSDANPAAAGVQAYLDSIALNP